MLDAEQVEKYRLQTTVMSFHVAEAINAAFGGLTNVLREALHEPGYVRNPYQVFDNMEGDGFIDAEPTPDRPASRSQLLERIAAHRADLTRIKSETVLFCRENLLQGPAFQDPTIGAFGRVTTFEGVVKGIHDEGSSLSKNAARALLRRAVEVPRSTGQLASQRLLLGGKRLSLYSMWSFPVADRAQPLAELGGDKQSALDILGLGAISVLDEVVGFAHLPPATIPTFSPTAWDAGCYACWRPGGRTYYLSVEKYGLREVVHDRIRGEHLMSPIEVLP